MAGYSYQLIIPPEVKISRRDPNSTEPVPMSRETREEFGEIEQAESRAVELINDNISRLPDVFRIERVPDGVTVRDHPSLKALADKAKEEK